MIKQKTLNKMKNLDVSIYKILVLMFNLKAKPRFEAAIKTLMFK